MIEELRSAKRPTLLSRVFRKSSLTNNNEPGASVCTDGSLKNMPQLASPKRATGLSKSPIKNSARKLNPDDMPKIKGGSPMRPRRRGKRDKNHKEQQQQPTASTSASDVSPPSSPNRAPAMSLKQTNKPQVPSSTQSLNMASSSSSMRCLNTAAPSASPKRTPKVSLKNPPTKMSMSMSNLDMGPSSPSSHSKTSSSMRSLNTVAPSASPKRTPKVSLKNSPTKISMSMRNLDKAPMSPSSLDKASSSMSSFDTAALSASPIQTSKASLQNTPAKLPMSMSNLDKTSASTRSFKKTVLFESPKGRSKVPQKNVNHHQVSMSMSSLDTTALLESPKSKSIVSLKNATTPRSSSTRSLKKTALLESSKGTSKVSLMNANAKLSSSMRSLNTAAPSAPSKRTPKVSLKNAPTKMSMSMRNLDKAPMSPSSLDKASSSMSSLDTAAILGSPKSKSEAPLKNANTTTIYSLDNASSSTRSPNAAALLESPGTSEISLKIAIHGVDKKIAECATELSQKEITELAELKRQQTLRAEATRLKRDQIEVAELKREQVAAPTLATLQQEQIEVAELKREQVAASAAVAALQREQVKVAELKREQAAAATLQQEQAKVAQLKREQVVAVATAARLQGEQAKVAELKRERVAAATSTRLRQEQAEGIKLQEEQAAATRLKQEQAAAVTLEKQTLVNTVMADAEGGTKFARTLDALAAKYAKEQRDKVALLSRRELVLKKTQASTTRVDVQNKKLELKKAKREKAVQETRRRMEADAAADKRREHAVKLKEQADKRWKEEVAAGKSRIAILETQLEESQRRKEAEISSIEEETLERKIEFKERATGRAEKNNVRNSVKNVGQLDEKQTLIESVREDNKLVRLNNSKWRRNIMNLRINNDRLEKTTDRGDDCHTNLRYHHAHLQTEEKKLLKLDTDYKKKVDEIEEQFNLTTECARMEHHMKLVYDTTIRAILHLAKSKDDGRMTSMLDGNIAAMDELQADWTVPSFDRRKSTARAPQSKANRNSESDTDSDSDDEDASGSESWDNSTDGGIGGLSSHSKLNPETSSKGSASRTKMSMWYARDSSGSEFDSDDLDSDSESDAN